MENSSFAKVYLEEKLDSFKGAALTTCVFIAGLIGFLYIGYKGPDVYARESLELPYDNLNVTWYGYIQDLQPQNQLLFLQMRIMNPTDTDDFSYIQSYKVDTMGSHEPAFESPECPYGCSDCPRAVDDGVCSQVHDQSYNERSITCRSSTDWCDWTTLLMIDFVDFETYYLKADMTEPEDMVYSEDSTKKRLEFELVYVTQNFTNYEFALAYSLCICMLIFMFAPKLGFFTSMWQLHKSFWSRQQLWVGTLLVTCFFFNNPLFALQIFSSHSRAVFDLYVVFLATFFATLLFFWLEIFSDMGRGDLQGTDPRVRFERNRKKAFKEYAPKVVLVFLMWLSTILVYSYVRVKQRGDPSYSSVDDLSSFTGIKVLALILVVVYFTWLFVHMARAFRYLGSLLPCYRFLLLISLITVVFSVLSMFSGGLAPNQHGSTTFAFYMGLYNLYVIVLAICYTPVGTEYELPEENGERSDSHELEMTASGDDSTRARGREFTII